MKYLLYASRLAFICNLFFIVCFIIQRTHDFINQPDLTAIVIILGWMVAHFLNMAVNFWYAGVLVSKSSFRLPLWLAFTNLFLVLIQLYIYFILPS